MTLLARIDARVAALDAYHEHEQMTLLTEAKQQIEQLRQSVKEGCYCPHPANSAPVTELTVGHCMARSECRCNYRKYFADADEQSAPNGGQP